MLVVAPVGRDQSHTAGLALERLWANIFKYFSPILTAHFVALYFLHLCLEKGARVFFLLLNIYMLEKGASLCSLDDAPLSQGRMRTINYNNIINTIVPPPEPAMIRNMSWHLCCRKAASKITLLVEFSLLFPICPNELVKAVTQSSDDCRSAASVQGSERTNGRSRGTQRGGRRWERSGRD